MPIIMLNFFTLSNVLLPHFGQETLCFSIIASSSAVARLSGTMSSIFSAISLSALDREWHFLHCTIGSLKLLKWPDALKTSSGKICAPSISTMPSFSTSSFLQKSTRRRLTAWPTGPNSQNPARALE